MRKRYFITQKKENNANWLLVPKVAHLDQHYNKDEDGKLGHGSAVGWV